MQPFANIIKIRLNQLMGEKTIFSHFRTLTYKEFQDLFNMTILPFEPCVISANANKGKAPQRFLCRAFDILQAATAA